MIRQENLAVLIGILEVVVLLDIVIDGGLDNNKTLRRPKNGSTIHVMKKCIFVVAVKEENKKDLPLITELVKYTSVRIDHSECWPKVCWIIQNPELVLCEPNLLNSTSEKRKRNLLKCLVKFFN
ncbi:hypothetical protein RclHR1_08890007 [Rhizophagus clarus]|uniref:Uncharacterized protein n=1 Tax=Rhizophagus clarus TaxID=94130 RepID=A0A2Z6SH63_9GLOM|nr:hypothetical protein RclHR1_08890007 [Rhizophagus clarus]